MRWASVTVSLLALLGLSGCPAPCDDCFPCAAPPPVIADQPVLMLVGQEMQVNFPEAIASEPCGNTLENRPTSAISEVTGPDGALIPSEVTFDGPGSPPAPVLRFTPRQPGAHHLLVLFSPAGGLHQLDIFAALDRSAGLTTHQLSSTSCTSLERTLQGAWVCDSQVLRGDALVQQFEGARLAVAGDVVWVVDVTRLLRMVDTGSTLTQTGSLSYSYRSIEFVLPGQDEILVLSDDLIMRYDHLNARVTTGITERTTLPVGSDTPPRILLREGNRLGVVRRNPLVQGGVVEVCSYLIRPDEIARTPEDCQPVTGLEVIGFEPNALWTADASFDVLPSTIRRWVWAGGRLTEQGVLSLRGDFQLVISRPQRNTMVPVVRPLHTFSRATPLTAVVAWSPARQALVLEHLDTQAVDPLASPSLYWGRIPLLSTRNDTRIRVRPNSPP
jgi:hypothetical protein